MRKTSNLLLLSALLSACSASSGDWRADAIAAAQAKMRDLINDPAATFSHVDLTGDSKTGQTCGDIISKVGIFTKEARFIVYIDNSAGPSSSPASASRCRSPTSTGPGRRIAWARGIRAEPFPRPARRGERWPRSGRRGPS